MRPYVVEAWDCGVMADLRAHQDYLQKIANDYKGDVYFWSWINHEKYVPEDPPIPQALQCPQSQGQTMEDWVNNKLWGYVYPQSYQQARRKMLDLRQRNEKIFSRIKEFEERRAEWWEELRVDLKKLCSLIQQVKRLAELKLHLTASCASSSAGGPTGLCRKELVNVEKLIEREEAPLKENQEKMKSKWPYLESIINSRDMNCEIE